MADKNMDDIAEFFKTMRFQKKLIGGVSEKSVWRQLDLLQKEYRSAYEIQQGIYENLLQKRDEEIAALKAQLSQGQCHE